MSSNNNGQNFRSNRLENVLMQDEFFIPGDRGCVILKLTSEALLWSPTSKKSFTLKRLFSGTFASQEDEHALSQDAQQLVVQDGLSEIPSLQTSQSFPNGLNSSVLKCHRLSLSDIVGCEVAKGKSKQDQAGYLRIYAYPLLKSFPWKECVRKRKELVLGLSKETAFEKNIEELEKWQKTIVEHTKKLSAVPLESDLATSSGRKKLLVLVNPFGGAGKALHVFQSRVIPILAEAGIPYETVITKYRGHAKDVVKDVNLKVWGGIVVVSGDGLIYEVINGLLERADRLEAIRTPVGVVPGGSGNALVSSFLYQAGESFKHNIITNSTLLLAKNRIQPMDLVALETHKGDRLYSFLSVTWGIVADVDIESEKYRNLGKARFTVGAITRIVALRKYAGSLHFLPINPAYKSKWSSYDKYPCEISDTAGRPPPQSGTHEHDAANAPSRSLDPAGHDVPTPLLVPLDQPVPNGWVTMTADDFVTVVAIYQSHLSQDMLVFPHSRLKDGCIYLGIVRGNIPRYRVLQMFNAMQRGTLEILEDDCCEVVKVAAFRLEPCAPQGIITVDGEVVDYGPIQGQVVEGLARMFS